MKTQKQMYWEAHRKSADRDIQVMDMINCKENPLTKKDLHALADKYPNRYERYRNLLDKGPVTPSGKSGEWKDITGHISHNHII